MNKYFPLTKEARDIPHLIVVLLFYCLFAWAAAFVASLVGYVIGWIPLLGSLVSVIVALIAWFIRLYCGVGFIYTLLKYFNIVK